MLKLILSGVWACIVTLGSSYAVTAWKANHPSPPAPEEAVIGLESKKTNPLDVPMIADGAVQGYIVAQFVFTADSATMRKLSVPPEIFVSDEAFRALYSDPDLDFRHLEKYDINKLTKTLVQKTNERLHMELVKDVLVQEFNYVTRDDMKR